MPQQITGAFARLRDAVAQFTLAQRTLAIIGIAALVLGGFALTTWLSRPEMSPLFANVSTADASAIVDVLNGQGVQYELADGGTTVMVAKDKLYAMRLAVAAKGLPAGTDGSAGYSLLDSMSMTASDFQQQVTYQRALEGELAKTVSAMDGVKTASVKLALPDKSVFVSQTSDPTASVFVETAPGSTLSSEQVQAIVHLVSAGIQGMKPSDVSVIGADGTVLSTVGGDSTLLADQQTTQYEQRVRTSVQSMLDKVVGAGKAVVSVTADLNYDQTQRTSETYAAPEGNPVISSSTQKETYTGTGGTGSGGLLGSDNLQVEQGGNGTYSNESQVLNNGIDKVTEQTTTAPGTVRRQSISVAVDQTAAAALNMADLQTMVSNAAGIDPARGDTVSVSAMTFDTAQADAAKQALAEAEAAASAAQRMSLIKQGAIAAGIVVLLVIGFFLSRRRSKARREALDLGELEAASRRAELIEAAGEATKLLPAAPDSPENQMAAKRAAIAELAEDQPDEVADVLRSWIGAGSR